MQTSTVLSLLLLFPFVSGTKDEKILSTRLANGWQAARWDNFVDSKIEIVCADEARTCESNIRWKDLLGQELVNATEVWAVNIDYVIDIQRLLSKNSWSSSYGPYSDDLGRAKRDDCNLVIVKGIEDESKRKSWVRYHTENTCDWEEVESLNVGFGIPLKPINMSGNETGLPDNCSWPGWGGKLEAFIEDGAFKINWTSLVMRPRCIKSVTLLDEGTGLKKKYTTTRSDEENFLIEYKVCSCYIVVILTSIESCRGHVGWHVPCQSKEVHRDPSCKEVPLKANSTSMTIIAARIAAILGLIAFIVVVIIAARRVMLKKKREKDEKPREEKELNEIYGTYYRVVEYNTATDDNPRYNEDEGNDDAIVTDENTDYSNPMFIEIRGNNSATSTNGNIYAQL